MTNDTPYRLSAESHSAWNAVPSWVISSLTSALVTLLFMAFIEGCRHWFVLPVFVCGALAGVDAVNWLRGKTDLFDPVGILGLLMTFTLFVTPFLHVTWNVWMWEVSPPADWREWVGRMAAVNVAAMLAYLGSKRFFSGRDSNRPSLWLWRPDPQLFWIVGVLLVCLTLALQLWIYNRHGGLMAYIDDYRNPDAHYKFQGMGPIYMIADSLPSILGALFIVYRTRGPMKQPWLILGAFLLSIFALRVVTGGLRGSRLSIVMSLFWMVGAIHLMVRPIPRRVFALGTLSVIPFMYIFLTYKDGGDLEKLFDAEERKRLQSIHNRSFEGVIVGDLGRTDVQAYMLFKLLSDPEEFRYARGDTYLYAACIMIPSMLLPDRPKDKTIYGADLIYGPGSFVPTVMWSSRIYGLAGEAMMNFTPVSVPIAFILLGFVVARFQRFVQSLQPGDVRLFLAPFGVYICMWMYISDSDNVVSQFFLYGFVPLLFIVSTARRIRTGESRGAPLRVQRAEADETLRLDPVRRSSLL